MTDGERLQHCVSRLNGDRDRFADIVGDAHGLMAKVCRYAEIVADRNRRQAWSIIGEITGHGSGVATAIYEYYRERKDGE